MVPQVPRKQNDNGEVRSGNSGVIEWAAISTAAGAQSEVGVCAFLSRITEVVGVAV